jgi:hypothetical protein
MGDKIVLLDIQYFKKNNTIAIKEISALFYPSLKCISQLFSHSSNVGGNEKQNYTNNYVIDNLHGLDYNSGYKSYRKINSYVHEFILKPSISAVIVKGGLKQKYIQDTFNIHTINIETVFPNMPSYSSFRNYHNCRYYHLSLSKQFCAYKNVKNLYKYLSTSSTLYLQRLYDAALQQEPDFSNITYIQPKEEKEEAQTISSSDEENWADAIDMDITHYD